MTLHKQQLVKFGLTAISALILTACGSSGGGSSAPSSVNTAPANQIQQPSQPKAEAKPEQPAQPKVEAKPEQPAQPKVEAKPEQPVQPKVEAKPEQPVQPKVEAKPEQPVQPKVEVKPEQPVQPKVEVKPKQPVQPKVEEKPEQPVQPKVETKPEQPVQPKVEAKPEQPVQPKVETKPEQPVQPKVEAKPEQPIQPKVEAKPEQPVQPKVETKPEQPTEKVNHTGEYIIIGGYGEPIESKKFTSYSANKIMIDGAELSLLPEYDHHQNSWNIAADGNGKDIISCCHSFSDMRVGVVNDLEQNFKTLFYNGNPTLNMPKGSASYNGVAIFDGYEFREETLHRSTSSFNVNFDDKKLDGHLVAMLKNDKTKTIDILADIDGNRFKGNAAENNGTLKGEVEGKFFGEQAKELGGVVKGNTLSTENGWGAAFGAQKQQ